MMSETVVDDEFYQVEGLIDSHDPSIEDAWKRNGQKHDCLEQAARAASPFKNARDIVDTRIVFVQKSNESRVERIVEPKTGGDQP